MINGLFAKASLAGFAVAMLIGTCAVAEQWTVTLTPEQNEKFRETRARPNHTVFAISPDSAWGRTWDYKSLEEAKTNALGFCRDNLRRGQRDCMVFAVDGKVVLPATVQTKVPRALYKPVSGKKAAAFFGLRNVAFQGNPAAAEAQWRQVKDKPGSFARLPFSKDLGRKLLGNSIVLDASGGFSLAFTKYGARHVSKTQNGTIAASFGNWGVTADGLLCVTHGAWEGTGKRFDINCMIISSIAAGKLRFAWGHTSGKSRKGFLVAGDAGRGAAR